MKKFKKIIGLSLAAAMILTMSATSAVFAAEADSSSAEEGFAEEPVVVLKMAEHNADGTFHAKTLEYLADQVYQESKGRIQIDIYNNGVLGAVTEGLTMLDTGVCDIFWASTAFFANQFPYSEFTDLPSLGMDDAIMATNVWWDVFEKYPELFEKEYEGYHVWCQYDGPALCVGTSKHLDSPEDLKGLNLRAAAGAPAKIAAAWGANPTTVSPADLYMAMQKGVVDGYMFALAGAASLSCDDLTDTAVDVSLGYTPVIYLMSQAAWDSLSPEDQEVMNNVGNRVGSIYSAEQAEIATAETIENIPNYIHPESEDDEWYQALQGPLSDLTEEWVAANSTDDFDAQELIDFAMERVAYYKANK